MSLVKSSQLKVTNCTFKNIYAEDLIMLYERFMAHNTNVTDLRVEKSIFSNSAIVDIHYYEGLFPIYANSKQTVDSRNLQDQYSSFQPGSQAYIMVIQQRIKRNLPEFNSKYKNIHYEDAFAPAFFILQSATNIFIDNAYLSNSGELYDTTKIGELVLNELISLSEIYIINPQWYPITFKCGPIMRANQTKLINVKDFNIQQLLCTQSEDMEIGFQLSDIANLISFSSVQFQSFTYQNSSPLININYSKNLTSFLDVEFNEIENTKGPIGIQISQSSKIEIYSSKFKSLKGVQSPCFILNDVESLRIADCIVQDVTSQSGSGVGSITFGSEENDIVIDGLKINSVIAKDLSCGLSFISSKDQKPINIQITSMTIENSECQSSALFDLDRNIKIQNAQFKSIKSRNTKVNSGGLITDSHISGLIEYSDLQINGNSGKYCGIIANLSGGTENLINISGLTVKDTTCDQGIMYFEGDSTDIVVSIKTRLIQNNKGRVFTISNISLELQEGRYETNEQVVVSLENGKINAFKVNFNGNGGENVSGGAFELAKGSYAECTKCNVNYSEGIDGAAFYVSRRSWFLIAESNFAENRASNNGSAIYLSGSDQNESKIQKCTFTNNFAEDKATIYIFESDIIIEDTIINKNKANGFSAGIVSAASNIGIYRCGFENQQSMYGSFIFATTQSTIILEDSNLSTGQATFSSGGAISLFTSKIEINNCKIFNMQAETVGGALAAYANSTILIQQLTRINDCYSNGFGGAIFASESNLHILDTQIKRFGLGGIVVQRADLVKIENSVMDMGTGNNGGALGFYDCKEIYVFSTVFSYNEADFGGAVYIYQSYVNNDAIVQFKDCEFYSNSAIQGGALWFGNSNAKVDASTFQENQASGDGGAVLVDCLEQFKDICYYELINNIFTSNNAEGKGGGVYWSGKSPVLENNVDNNNTSSYGSLVAAFPIAMRPFNETILPYLETADEINPIAYEIPDVAPGQNFNQVYKLAFVDQYQQIVTDNEIREALILTTNNQDSIRGVNRFVSEIGILDLKDFQVLALPLSTTYLRVVTSSVDISMIGDTGVLDGVFKDVYLKVHFRRCITGEYDKGMECEVCQPGFYSLDTTEECQPCPKGGRCEGRYVMYPLPGYWRANQFTDEFLECKYEDACEGSPYNNDPKGECAEGYKGNLCNSCKDGYARSGTAQCSECPENWENLLLLFVFITCLTIVISILVYTTLRSALQEEKLHSIYLKIFANYMQLVLITTSFDLSWPKPIENLFLIQKTAGGITSHLFSFDCLISQDKNAYEIIYYTKLEIVAVTPLILCGISTCIWLIFAIVKQNVKHLWGKIIATSTIIFFLILPYLVDFTFTALNCEEISGEGQYLKIDMDIECWNDKHISHLFSVVLPMFLAWIVIIPGMVLYYLTVNKIHLFKTKHRIRFGFLYNGYRKTRYYWEFVIMYRKIIYIFLSVFSQWMSNEVKGLTALLILIIALYLQKFFNPFTYPQLDEMEFRSILCATVTIYSGNYFLTNGLSEPSKLFFYFLIFGANVYFLLYWLYYILKAGADIAKHTLPGLKQKYMSHDIYGRNGLQNDPIITNVYMQDDEFMYTILQLPELCSIKQQLPASINNVFVQTMFEDMPVTSPFKPQLAISNLTPFGDFVDVKGMSSSIRGTSETDREEEYSDGTTERPSSHSI